MGLPMLLIVLVRCMVGDITIMEAFITIQAQDTTDTIFMDMGIMGVQTIQITGVRRVMAGIIPAIMVAR